MREIRDILAEYKRHSGEALALATLVRSRGSSYRRPGARMLIAADGKTVGVLSGGCLEEEVAACAQEVFASGRPLLLSFDTRLRYGCHGSIDIFVEKAPTQALDQIALALGRRQSCHFATTFADSHSLGSHFLYDACPPHAGTLVQTIAPPLQLLLVGHGPDSAPLKSFAHTLGWDVIESEDVASLPDEFDEWTVAVVKTHNYGRDYAALARLLPLGLRYVALLGPRRRRDQLFHALADEGVSIRSDLFAPAGLDIGAESPEEIALTIVAEIQATLVGGNAEPLRERKAPIHAGSGVSRSTDALAELLPNPAPLLGNWESELPPRK
ncbi:MAG TPA: XdhC family protein [Chthoniobacterales bacterium]|jgi:xanthine/CO dehydrogenase XdhC/CoxF family maturation factor